MSPRSLNPRAEHVERLFRSLVVELEVFDRHVPRNECAELTELRRELAETTDREADYPALLGPAEAPNERSLERTGPSWPAGASGW